MDRWIDGSTDGWIDGWTDWRIDGWMNGIEVWIDGKTDGRTGDRCIEEKLTTVQLVEELTDAEEPISVNASTCLEILMSGGAPATTCSKYYELGVIQSGVIFCSTPAGQ